MKFTGVILVGGKGKRLKNLTRNTAKPLILINDKPFLDYLLYYICQHRFDRIYLVCSFKSNDFFKKYDQKYIFGVKIICIKEKKPNGTAGALLEIKDIVKKDFFLFNGDSFFPIDLENFYKFSKKSKKIINIAFTKNNTYKSNKKISNVCIKKNLVYFSKDNTDIMNGGIYFISLNFLKKITKNKKSLENDYLKKFIDEKKVSGKVYKNYFVDIGIKKNLKFARKTLIKNFNTKAFFLDRDGVINKDFGYVYEIEKFKFLPGVLKGLKIISENKFLIIIVTNQSGIGRGYYSKKQFFKLNEYLIKKILNSKSNIDDIYFCPHHPKEALNKFKKECQFRKPNPGMINLATKNWSIIKDKSFMIGDKNSDKMAARNSGVKFFYKKKTSFDLQIKKILSI